jgi:amino acid adenylation domain-containing protein
MTIAQLLASLYSEGITVWVEETKLKYRAPQGALSNEIKSQLLARRAEIIEFLQASTMKPAAIPTAPRDGALPLSFAEEELWLIDRMQPGMTVWNMQAGVRIHGALDVAAFQRSLNSLIERHETLRTSFRLLDGEAVRVVAPTLAVELAAVSLQASKDTEGEIRRIAAADKKRPFDLSAAPLFRVRLLRLSEAQHVFLFTFHHIISDASSTRIFFRDLMALYQAHVHEQPPALVDLAVQYSDYAAWVRQRSRETIAAHLAYWRSKLKGFVIPEIPGDYRRPEQRSYRGATQRIQLSSALSTALRELCKQEQATVFMLLLAAFKLLLRRYTGSDDIVVGSAMAGRYRPELEPLIGMFINVVPLRTDLSGQTSFRELLRRVREVCLEAYQHQDMPFGKLVEELNPSRGPSRNPFFQVLFDVANLPPNKHQTGALTVETLPRREDTARYEIVIRAPETSAGIAIWVDYATDLFLPARIAEMLEQYKQLLEQIVENRDRDIDEYTLVTATARRILPDLTAPLDPDWPGPVPALFARQVNQHPDKIAVTDGFESWSYQELNRRANQLAWFLRHHGVGREDVVAIYGQRSAGLVWALIAILKAGGAFFILDPTHPMQRLAEYFDAVRAKALITLGGAKAHASGANLSFGQKLGCRIELPRQEVTGDDGFLSEYSQDDPAVEVTPDDLACVIFTSGSTGKPKAVMGRHSPLTHFLPWISENFEISARDRFSALAGLSSNILQREICTALAVGATLCIPNPDDIGASGKLDQWMRDEAITVVHLTPAMAQVLDESATQPVPSVRRVFFAGDLLKMRDVERVRKIMPSAGVVNFYASSESQRAGGYIVIPERQEPNAKDIPPLGRGVQDVQLLVMKPDGQMSGIGELGEIWVRSPHLARGYLGDEKLTAERFLVNPFTADPKDRIYRTGEQGRFSPTGEVEFAGRAENQVSIRGFRIELSEIESALEYHPGVGKVAVLGREDRSGDKRLIAYVVPKQEPAPTSNELRGFLKQRLPDYMVPFAFIFLNELPLSPSGKVDRTGLPEVNQSRPDLENDYVAPRSPVEKVLAEIWLEILNLEKVGVHDNFFDLGGHSVLAVRLAAEVERKFRRSISAATPFQAPTISHMARVLSQLNKERTSLIAIQTSGVLPPFFCVHGHEAYFQLARHLGSNQPLYGLAQHFDGQKLRYTRIEEIAAHYISEVQTIQPQGPYFLGGFSTGGLIAFEMAQQLRARREEIALLAMFNVARPQPVGEAAPMLSDQGGPSCWSLRKLLRPQRLRSIVAETLVNSAKAMTCHGYHALNRTLPPQLQNFYIDKIVNAKLYSEAGRRYELKRYPGRLIFFKSEQGPDRSAPWRALAQEGIEIYRIPGDHSSIFAEPGIAVLADCLKACLERARRERDPEITNVEAPSESRVSL